MVASHLPSQNCLHERLVAPNDTLDEGDLKGELGGFGKSESVDTTGMLLKVYQSRLATAL